MASSSQQLSFVMIPSSLLEQDPYTYKVYAAIKSHFPVCFPSIKRLAKVAKCSHVTVIDRIKLLSQFGLLKVIRGRRGQSNRYEIPDSYLTPAEREAKRRGSWKDLSWRKVLACAKKVVNPRNSEHEKVVKPASCNKIQYKQEAGLPSSWTPWSQMVRKNPEIVAHSG